MVMYLLRLYYHSHRQSLSRRGSHIPEIRIAPEPPSPERQVLTRIAEGRCGCQRPAVWQVKHARARLKCDVGPEGAGETDEVIADELGVSAGSVGR